MLVTPDRSNQFHVEIVVDAKDISTPDVSDDEDELMGVVQVKKSNNRILWILN